MRTSDFMASAQEQSMPGSATTWVISRPGLSLSDPEEDMLLFVWHMKQCQPHSLLSFVSSATTAAAARSALDCTRACHNPANKQPLLGRVLTPSLSTLLDNCAWGFATMQLSCKPQRGQVDQLELSFSCVPEPRRALLYRACDPGAQLKHASVRLGGGVSQGRWVSLPEKCEHTELVGMSGAGKIPWIEATCCW